MTHFDAISGWTSDIHTRAKLSAVSLGDISWDKRHKRMID